MGGPPLGKDKPPPGARPPWSKHKDPPKKPESATKEANADGMHGGFVARMRLKQKQEAEEAEKQRLEDEKLRRRDSQPKADFFALTKMKKQVTALAKKQTIKRTSDYEKGHPWHCAVCGKRNRAVHAGCVTCGRPQRCHGGLYRPSHGVENAGAIRSLQGNYIFKDGGGEATGGVNAMDDGRWTALHNAAAAGNPGLVETLCNNGAVVEAKTALGFRPLHFAAASRSLKCVDALIKFGARVNGAVTNASKLSPLHIAARHGHPGIVKLLIDAGAQVNIVDSGSRTPLHLASDSGYLDAAVELINAGADMAAQDTDGWTPKQVAEFRGHTTFMEYYFRKENPGMAVKRIVELPPQKWHSKAYFDVKENVADRKRRLEDDLRVQSEVQEMLRLHRQGKSFLESSFHAEMTRELTTEEIEGRLESDKMAAIKLQI